MLGLNAGTAYVSIKPDLRGMHTSMRSQLATTGRQFDAAGASAGSTYQKSFGRRFLGGLGTIAKRGALTLGTIGVLGGAAIAKSSIKLEQEFGSTMNQIGAATEAPKRQLKAMADLALRMGADTVFSANEASAAMLELAKGGMKPATIQAGGLKGTLQLAAAGGTDMATAAMIASDALNVFNLRGKDMKSVAAALAGGANASSASVESLGLAMSQAGLSAKDAGLNVQETVAVLAAFDNAGIKGSDAGTSLKTMLTRLTPQTAKARDAMRELGIDFTDAQGRIKPISEVASILQAKLGKLSQEERNTALSTMFGSDARRAALVLMDEGGKGLDKYIKKTKDQGAAQRMADARMKGTAGAIEKMKGSFETAGLAIGMALRPVTIAIANMAAEIANKAIPYIQKFGKWIKGRMAGGNIFEQIADWVTGLLPKLRKIGPDAKKAFNDIGPALSEAKAELPKFTDLLDVAGVVLRFLAKHSDKVAKALPYLAAGFLAVKVAQVAANAAAAVSVPLRIAEMVANRRLAASNNALVSAIRGQTGAVRASTAAEATNTGAKNRGIAASVRSRVTTIAKSVAEKASAAATRAMAVAQRILNAAMRANLIGVIITALLLLGAAVVVAWKKSDTFRKIVTAAWDKIKQAVSVAWNRVIKPAFKAIADWVTGTLIPVIRRLWENVVKPAFSKIGQAVKWAWEHVIKPAVRALVWYWEHVLGPVLKWLWNKVVKPVFGWIGDKVVSVWNNVIKPVFQKLGSFVRETVAPAFRKGISAIGRAWDWLKNAATRPINFIIDTVYNNGIRKFVNGLLDRFGIETRLPYVMPIGANKRTPGASTGRTAPGVFAEGGVLPGFTPGRDVHTFSSPTAGRLKLSGGEAVMRPEWTRAIGGPREVERLNRAAVHGRLGRDAWRFARGGTIPAEGSWNRHASGYPWASWAGDINVPGGGDYGNPVRAYDAGNVAFTKSLTTSYGKHVGINHPGGSSTLYAHLSRIMVNAGQQVARGALIGRVGSTGNSSGPHLHFEIKGAHLTPGAATDGKSWTEKLVTKFADWAADEGRSLIGKIPGAGIFTDVAKGLGNKTVDGIRDWIVERWGGGTTGTGPIPKGPVVEVARRLAAQRGWTGAQWSALSELVSRESSWNPRAQNPTSSAYGLFQFLDSTWSSVGGRKTSDPGKQIVYGLRYIAQRYGTPRGAVRFHDAHNWYDRGGWLPHGGVARNNSGKPEPVFTDRQWRLLRRALTRKTLGGGTPITGEWLAELLDNVPKDARQLRREFVRTRDAMRGFRTRTLRARDALDELKGSRRFREARRELSRADRRLDDARSVRAVRRDIERERKTLARDRRAARGLEGKERRDALDEIKSSRERLKSLRKERDRIRELRKARREAADARPLARLDKLQKRLNTRVEAEKDARDAATRAAERYKAAQESALERARGIRGVGMALGTAEAAPSKTSGGIVASLRRAVRTVKTWRGLVGRLIGAGLRGPILDEYLDAGPSEDAVRLGKSLLAGGQIGEIVRLQNRLKRESVAAGARGARYYRPKPVSGARRASALPRDARAAADAGRTYQVVYSGMPADTVESIVQKTTQRVRYEIAREATL